MHSLVWYHKEIEEAFEDYLQTLSIFPAFTPETMAVASQAFKAGVQWQRERFSPKAKFYQERCKWLEKRLVEAEKVIEFYGSLRCLEREDDCDNYLSKRAKEYLEKYKGSE